MYEEQIGEYGIIMSRDRLKFSFFFTVFFLAQVPTANDVLMGIMETLGMEGNVQVRNETF